MLARLKLVALVGLPVAVAGMPGGLGNPTECEGIACKPQTHLGLLQPEFRGV